MAAGLFVDYFGTGELENAFHPTLQVCYLQGSLLVPPINLDERTSTGSWRFALPEGLTNPFIYCDRLDNASSYFRFVSGNTWDLHIVGHDFIDKYIGRTHNWSNPINKPSRDIYVRFGGYRG